MLNLKVVLSRMQNLWTYLFRSEQHPMVAYYSKQEIPLEEIRQYLSQFKGGGVVLTKDDSSGIATLCLMHPEKRNALSGKMMVDLSDAVDELEGWSCGKGVILHGYGNTFCSGGDLDFARQTGTPDGGFKMSCYMQDTLCRFTNLPLVTLALVEGAGALGGGAELAVSCDFRLLAAGSAGIGFVHSRMGLVPAWGGGLRLVRLLGPRRALDLLLSGRIVPPSDAVTLGLADDTVSDQGSLRHATDWLLARTQADVSVLRAAKAIVQNAQVPLDEILGAERRIFAPLWGGPANVKALNRNIKHRL